MSGELEGMRGGEVPLGVSSGYCAKEAADCRLWIHWPRGRLVRVVSGGSGGCR